MSGPPAITRPAAQVQYAIGTGGSDTFGGGGTVNTASAPYVLSGGQLANVLTPGGDFIMRARCQPAASFLSDMTNDRYYFAFKDVSNNETSLRFAHSTNSWILKIGGTDQASLYAVRDSNVLVWDAGHEVVLVVWYLHSLGKIGWRFEVNGVVNDGWYSRGAVPNYVDYQGWSNFASSSVTAGQVIRPSAGSLWWVYVAQNSATAGSSEPTWPTTEGATVVDSGVTWKATRNETNGGAALGTPVLFNLGSDLAGSHNFAATWDQLQFLPAGYGYQYDTAHVLSMGDSNDTAYDGFAPVCAYVRSVAESRANPKHVVLSHPGILIADTTNIYNGVSTAGVVTRACKAKGYPFDAAFLQNGINDVQFSHSTATIRTDYAAQISQLSGDISGIKLIGVEFAPAKGAGPVGANYTVYTQQNTDIAGGTQYPTLAGFVPYLSTMDDGSGNLSSTYNTPYVDGLHVNNLGRAIEGGVTSGRRKNLNTLSLAP